MKRFLKSHFSKPQTRNSIFKHMTIRQNIAFGLELRRVPKSKVRQRVEELLELVQLRGLGDRYPSQLSGVHVKHHRHGGSLIGSTVLNH